MLVYNSLKVEVLYHKLKKGIEFVYQEIIAIFASENILKKV